MMLGACAHPGHLRLPDGGASSSEMPAVASLVPPSPEAPPNRVRLSVVTLDTVGPLCMSGTLGRGPQPLA